MGGEANGTAALRALVAERNERGAQTVKTVVSGGAMTAGSDLLGLQFGLDEVRLVVEEAHRLGLAVTAHAHSVPSVEVCVAAGVDGIEHCTCLTAWGIHTPPALIDALAARGIQVCPTFGRLPGLPPSPQAIEVMRRTGMTLQARFEQVGALFAAGGVPILGGSDAGIHPAKPHGVLAYSVAELAQSGLPVAAALASATSAAANVCGLGGSRGLLCPRDGRRPACRGWRPGGGCCGADPAPAGGPARPGAPAQRRATSTELTTSLSGCTSTCGIQPAASATSPGSTMTYSSERRP